LIRALPAQHKQFLTGMFNIHVCLAKALLDLPAKV
jgi:hypothetical protein